MRKSNKFIKNPTFYRIMKIGFPNHPRNNILKEIEWIGKNGFDFVDLFLEEDSAVPEKIDVNKVRDILSKYNLGVVGHTAWYLPIGSPIKSIREASVLEAKKYFEVFSKLNVNYVTVHANWPPRLFSRAEGVNFQVDTLEKLVVEAKKLNINLMYEPIDSPKDSMESVTEVMKKVPGLYLHIDIGHMNLFGKNPEDFIKKFHKRISHIHMHDNNSESDLHLPIGTGSIEWKKLIPVLKKYYDGTITLEIFSPDKDYALLSKQKLKELWYAKK
jgi:sugar phosphate isomerase/epimerase